MSKYLPLILKKLTQGHTQQEVAKMIGVSQAAVSSSLKRMKFCPHCNKPLFKVGEN